MADITMPQLGETVTEGTITRWAKQVGDRVELDEVLFEVSTDKVDSEVPSSAAGFVSEILVPEGETVDVGTKLAVISDSPGAAGGGSGGGEQPQPAAEPAPTPTEAPAEAAPQETEPPAAEGEPAPAEPPAAEAPSEPAPAAPPADPQPAEQGETSGATTEGDGRLLSPVVRRLIAEHGLDLSLIHI